MKGIPYKHGLTREEFMRCHVETLRVLHDLAGHTERLANVAELQEQKETAREKLAQYAVHDWGRG
jgi:hypothetical protein